MRRTSIVLGALLLAVASLLPASPPAHAAPAPWHWVRVRDYVHIDPYGYYSIREFCPGGYTAITGGLQLPLGSRVARGDEYRFDDAAGSSWFVTFENSSPYHGEAWVVAECVRTTDLPPMSHNYVQVPTSGQYHSAAATVSCLNEGEVALTGGASWSNVNTRTLGVNGPGADGRSWHAGGTNSTENSLLAVEVYCVDPADVPGYVKVEYHQPAELYWEASATCPVGTRVLNGGSPDLVYASYPAVNKWTATGASPYVAYDGLIRVWCVAAGAPEITLTYASPGPDGSITGSTEAYFEFYDYDRAGMYADVQCALDHGPLGGCSETAYFPTLRDGPHEFVIVAETPDGRSASPVTYRWTIDSAAPTVSAPRLPQVSLTEGEVVRWSATDAIAGVDHHEAKYWRGRANGTTVDWTQPTAWADLASPVVRVPAMAAGDTLCLSVRAVDGVGNTSAWTTPRCTSRPFDDAVLTASSGWTRVTNTAYWNGTLTRTTLVDQTLQAPTARSRQLGVLATVCPGCGSVQVRIGGTVVGTISLDQPTARNRQVLLLPAFAEKTGAVTLTSTTSGKSIRIDGLVTVRRPAAGPG